MADPVPELLARARRGDADAFADLIEPHQRRAYNLALRLVGDSDLAADLVQDACLRAYTSLGRFRGDAQFGTWLFRIVHNVCLDALRWRTRHPARPLDEDELRRQADPAPGPEADALRQERLAAIAGALARLDPEFRAAVVLRDVQGFSYEEAASIAGVPLGTLKSRLHRAHGRLRELLAGSSVLTAEGEGR